MAWGDDIGYMARMGRAPSFDARGNVRGFRSRPGAPQADPTQNKGSVTYNTNPNLAGMGRGAWDQIFHSKTLSASNSTAGSLTGNALVGAGTSAPPPTTGVPHVDTALSTITGSQWGSNNNFTPDAASPDGAPPAPKPPAAPLDLTAMLNPTHAQAWGAPQLTAGDKAGGWQSGNASDILKKYQTPGTTASYGYGA